MQRARAYFYVVDYFSHAETAFVLEALLITA